MNTLAKSEELVELIVTRTHDLQMPATMRSRVAAACLGVALDHHHAIIILVARDRFASSFALVRIIFESFLRGAWLMHCASDQQIERFSTDWEPPKIDALLSDLEDRGGYQKESLSAIKGSAWRTMCSYTHTGSLQIQRWQTESSVEPRYEPGEITEVLSFANLIASLSAVELISIYGNEGEIEQFTESLGSYLPTKA